MSGGLETLAMTKRIGYIIYLQVIFTYACAKDITLTDPKTTIKAQIGEELRITCLGTKCQNPSFTWASLTDNSLSGTINNVGKISVLTMNISRDDLESYDSYRCTVACNNPPAEKSFKVVVYSFPEPILNISSLIAGQTSRITCTIPDAYPFFMFNVRILIRERVVAEKYDQDVDADIVGVKNISLPFYLTLTDEYDAQEIKCEAELHFQDGTDLIKKNKTMTLNLHYPPGKPNIAVSPDKIINIAENISLSCTFDSKSNASVQWVKLEKETERNMFSDGQGILTILNAKPEDSGIYICYVQNNAGKTSSKVNIIVQALPEKPTLTIYPTTIVQIGQYVRVECSANGNKNVNITLWKVLRDGDTPLMEGKEKLVIKEADPIDTAVYKCTAENQYGVSEASESLTVEYPPMETILTSSNEEVNEGGEVTLTCASKGVPEPIFFLYHLLPSGDSVLLSEHPMVTLTNVTSGVYECEARNSLGSMKERLELRVRFQPRKTFLNITPSLVTREGESVHIKCTSEAYPAPRLMLKKKTDMGLTELEAENGQYTITHITEEHAGSYICESTNVMGQDTAETTVTVQVPPKKTVLTISPSQVLNEGESGHLMCTSEAFPAPRLVLKKQTEAGSFQLEVESGEYSITHVGVEHAGTYICESTNEVGLEIAKTTLTVKVPPRNTTVVTPSQNITADVTVTITYDTHINPLPERQQSPRFNFVPPAIIGSVVLLTAGCIGLIAYHLKQAKVQGSYSLVKALKSTV